MIFALPLLITKRLGVHSLEKGFGSIVDHGGERYKYTNRRTLLREPKTGRVRQRLDPVAGVREA